MKIVILSEKSLGASNYRGVNRKSPYFVADLSEDHPANQLFLWYTSRYPNGYVEDVSKARKLVHEYKALTPPQEFSLFELTYDDEAPIGKGTLVGYDIVAYHNSVLSNGMNLYLSEGKHPSSSIICLIGKYFEPKLNSVGLFNDYELALFCYECMQSLQDMNPDVSLWEMNHMRYRVVGLYTIPS